MRRRCIIKAGIIGGLGFSEARKRRPADDITQAITRTPLPRRELGRTREMISILGLGGVVLTDSTPEEAAAAVREAISHGINYFDVAPSYGNAEVLLGPALKPYRDRVFLACKTQSRDRQGAQEELDRSLERLQTDHIDLYQFHAFTSVREVDQALGRRGALETFIQAKNEGKVRFIGFSAHSEEAALRAMERFDFDTLLFPVNFVGFLKAGFGPDVILRAQRRGMGILAIKAMARQPWPDESLRKHWPKAWYQPVTAPEEADLALRFTLSQPVSAAIPPGDIRLLRMALEIAHGFTPLHDGEMRRLRQLSAGLTPLFPLEGNPA
jgi:aryl-alcohol dehydrogenase-like predicted oxidoreductase